MIKFTNTEKYLKKYSIDIRGEEYPIKIPTLKEWLIINSIDFSDLNKIREIRLLKKSLHRNSLHVLNRLLRNSLVFSLIKRCLPRILPSPT